MCRREFCNVLAESQQQMILESDHTQMLIGPVAFLFLSACDQEVIYMTHKLLSIETKQPYMLDSMTIAT